MSYTTKEAVAALVEPDADLAEYFKTGPPLPKPDFAQPYLLRAAERADVDMMFEVTKRPEVVDSVEHIVMRDGYSTEVRVFKPRNPPAAGSPLAVLCHGGGWVHGDNKQLAPISRAICSLYGAVVVNLSYRLAPEYMFPSAWHDTYDSLKYLAANASAFGADTSQGFILGGVSAGGSLSAAIGQKTVTEKWSTPLTGLWLYVPALFADNCPPPEKYRDVFISREQNAHAPILGKEAVDIVFNSSAIDGTSDWWSPFNDPHPHEGMPRTYFHVDGADTLRDDGLIYERVLAEHGVPTRIDVYKGMPHAGHFFAPAFKGGLKANIDTVLGLGWLLGKEATPEEAIKALTPPALAPPAAAPVA